MDVHSIIATARAAAPQLPGKSVLESVQFVPIAAQDAIDEQVDKNEDNREQVCIALNSDLQPKDRAFVRYLLQQETAAHRAAADTILDNLKRCAYLLYRLGYVEDSLLLWEAKQASFDTYAGLDIQLLIGAGLDETISYVQAHPNYADLLEYIEDCRTAGDFANMDEYERFIAAYFNE